MIKPECLFSLFSEFWYSYIIWFNRFLIILDINEAYWFNIDTIWTLVQVEDNDSFQNELSRQLVESINLGSPMQSQPNILNPFSTSQQNQTENQVSAH